MTEIDDSSPTGLPPALDGTDPSEEANLPPASPPGGLSFEQARQQSVVLARASRASPVRQTRYLLAEMADEWERAATGLQQCLEMSDAPAVVELAGSVTKGMRVWELDLGWLKVTRILRRPGDWALHCTISDPGQLEYTQNRRDQYLNFFGDESPVVVMA